MKNKTRQIVALLVTAAMLTGCGAVQNQDVVSPREAPAIRLCRGIPPEYTA